MWFSIVMLVYQRVVHGFFCCWLWQAWGWTCNGSTRRHPRALPLSTRKNNVSKARGRMVVLQHWHIIVTQGQVILLPAVTVPMVVITGLVFWGTSKPGFPMVFPWFSHGFPMGFRWKNGPTHPGTNPHNTVGATAIAWSNSHWSHLRRDRNGSTMCLIRRPKTYAVNRYCVYIYIVSNKYAMNEYFFRN